MKLCLCNDFNFFSILKRHNVSYSEPHNISIHRKSLKGGPFNKNNLCLNAHGVDKASTTPPNASAMRGRGPMQWAIFHVFMI